MNKKDTKRRSFLGVTIEKFQNVFSHLPVLDVNKTETKPPQVIHPDQKKNWIDVEDDRLDVSDQETGK